MLFLSFQNSIRHNLSLHNRFVRIPNEIAGKSSWWTIDPRARQARRRRRVQSNENSTSKTDRRRLSKTVSNESSNPSSFDYLFSNEHTSSSSDEFYPPTSSSTSTQRSFTSVRDMNKNLYNLLQTNSSQNHLYTSTQAMPNILHDMLKSSPPSTSNTNDNTFNSGLFKILSFPSSSLDVL